MAEPNDQKEQETKTYSEEAYMALKSELDDAKAKLEEANKTASGAKQETDERVARLEAEIEKTKLSAAVQHYHFHAASMMEMRFFRAAILSFENAFFLLGMNPLAQLGKCGVFSVICQNFQQFHQFPLGIGMKHSTLSGGGILKIRQRTSPVVLLFFINFACRHTVTKHLRQIAYRHFHRLYLFVSGVIIAPVFKVMPISSFVVHPRQRIAQILSFRFIGAAIPLVVLHTLPKLRGAVFRQIMPQSLPKNSCFPTMPNHGMAMTGNRTQMPPK